MRLNVFLILFFLFSGSLLAQDPGGIGTGLTFWLRADSLTSTTVDGDTVDLWEDQTANGFDGTKVVPGPLFREAGANYNPGIDFGVMTGGLSFADLSGVNQGGGFTAKSYTIAFQTSSDVTSRQVIYEQGGGGTGMNLYIESGLLIPNLYNTSVEFTSNTTTIEANSTYIYTYIFDGGSQLINAYLNGSQVLTNITGPTSLNNHGGDPGMGYVNGTTQFFGDVSGSSEPFSGLVFEIAYYNNTVFSATDRNRLESYFALKYGGALSTNYVNSSGTTVWNTTTNTGFNENVAGIIRDDNSGELYQKQSKSEDADGLITIGLGTIENTNKENTSVIGTNQHSMLWGDNDSVLAFTSTGAPPGTLFIGRIWKIQETGTIGTVRLSVPSNSSSLSTKLPSAGVVKFLIDADGDFTSGSTSHSMVLVGDNWEATYDFSDGDYFSLAIEGAALSVTTQGSEVGPINIVYTVTLTSTNTTGSAITFDLDDLGTGTATSGSDYTAIPGSQKISVANGQISGTYTVNVTDDSFEESTETIILQISNPSDINTTVGTSTATAEITDDDSAIPGGVSTNLVFWFAADDGTSTTVDGLKVSTWTDKSGNSNDATENSPGATYTSLLDNFRPAINFPTADGGFNIADDADINSGGSAFNAKSYFISFKTGSDITSRQLFYEQGGATTGMNMFIESGDLQWNLFQGSTEYTGSGVTVLANTNYLASFIFDGANNRWDAYLDATSVDNNTSTISTLGTHSGNIGFGLINGSTQYPGDINITTDEGFFGHIMEMIYYSDTALHSTDKNQLESYLALKYGTTISTDYLASDGSTVFWDNSANSGYNDHIAGIGLDQLTKLDQKQAKSSVNDALVSIGLGSIQLSNELNTNNHPSDLSYLIWGSNDGSVAFTTTGAPAGDEILGRAWKVEETGTIGSVRMEFPASTSSQSTKLPLADALNLLVDADGDFSTGATSHPLTLVDTNWVIDLDLNNGEFFTISKGGANLTVTTNGNEAGTVDIVYTVTLLNTNISGSTISFDIDDAGTGTATSGDDYTAIGVNDKIEILNGQISGDYTVTVTDDSFEEIIETLILTISNPTPSTISIGNASATATITDNDNSNPGGVSTGLVYWLRANREVSPTTNGATITSVLDQSPNGHDASPVGTAPSYNASATNFNPAFDFSLITGGLTIPNSASINTSAFSTRSYTVAFRTGSDINTRQLIYEQGGGTHGLNLYIDDDTLYANLWVSSVESFDSVVILANTDYVFSFVYDGGSTRWDGYLNGDLVMSATSAPASVTSHTGLIGIGVINNDTQFAGQIDVTTGEGFLGSIMAISYYSGALSSTDRGKVETSFAAEYGITYSDNYLATDASNIWNPTTNSSYQNDVTAIGRDGLGGFFQTQSQSVNSDALFTLGLGSIAADNLSNVNTFNEDREYLVWGNDNGTLDGVASNASLTAESGAVDQLQRTWKIQEVGNFGSVELAVPKGIVDGYFTYSDKEGISLRVADDAGFTTNVVDVPMTSKTINGLLSYSANFTFSGDKFFTIVQTGFILWNGSEWRGGLSAIQDHGPSDETGDASKTMYIESGGAPTVAEGVVITNIEIEPGAVLTMDPQSCLILSGSALNNGTLNFEADATGYSQYRGPAVSASMQQYVPDEGWHNIGSPFSDAIWEDISFVGNNALITHPFEGVSLDTCSYCNVWYYDVSTYIGVDIGFGSSNAFGTWRSSIDSSQEFGPEKGWNMYLDNSSNFGSAPWTFGISGVFNQGTQNQIVNENNGGWNLVANPYPSSLDWTVVDDDIASDNLNLGYSVWDDENTVYATYLSGTGTSGANQYIAPYQGFYVQTSTAGAANSGDVFQTFVLEEGDRTTTCQTSGTFFKTENQDDLIRIQTTHNQSGKKDEIVLRFNDQYLDSYSNVEDARKLFSPNMDVSGIYSLVGNEYCAINSLFTPEERSSVSLGAKSKNNSSASLEITESPANWTIYLEDLKTGKWYNQTELPYTFNQDNDYKERFKIYFSENEFEPGKDGGIPFSSYVNAGEIRIVAERSIVNSKWVLYNIAGQIIQTGSLNLDIAEESTLPLKSISSGIYLFSLETNGEFFTQKIPYTRY